MMCAMCCVPCAVCHVPCAVCRVPCAMCMPSLQWVALVFGKVFTAWYTLKSLVQFTVLGTLSLFGTVYSARNTVQCTLFGTVYSARNTVHCLVQFTVLGTLYTVWYSLQC